MDAKKVYGTTVLVWAMAVVGHLLVYLFDAAYAPPTEEVYANGFLYQLTAFVLTRLSMWVLALILVLWLEFFVLRKK